MAEHKLQIDLGGMTFTVESGDINDLLTVYGKMGGNSQWIVNRIKESVSRVESGQVATANPDLDRAEQRQQPVPPAPDTSSDPWAQNGSGRASGGSGGSQKTDPWTGQPVSDNRGSQGSSAPQGTGTETLTDQWGNTWTLGMPDAIPCHCNPPEAAAWVKAKSQAGKWYTQWRCAKRAPGGDYQNACDLRQFPDKKN